MGVKIWVHAEVFEGEIADVAFELLSKASVLAKSIGEDAKVEATLVGCGIESKAALLAEYGAVTVHMADDSSLRLYSPATYVHVLAGMADAHKPDIYLFGATAVGTSLAPAVAARLKTGIAAHCVDIHIGGEKELVALVPSFGGKVIGEILCPVRRPQMASVKPGVLVKKSPAPVPVNIEKQELSSLKLNERPDVSQLEPVKTERHPPEGLPLKEADVVVCGGFGIGGSKNWQLLEELAQSLGGAAACTRPAVDEKWCEEHIMVGTSGQSISPKVYLGFGVSGATHHVCGMSKSGVVINVNQDAEAPIFDVSDFCVKADANSILPLLLDAVRPDGKADRRE
ncbi:MAG: electron transfer flavoprotein subunit alpha/FixB family protein [Synergistaceae bacterium]|jgi:electron transfer flavoprotein alpha subunit|nr:electron transfer flavoprotein subunit alpha/FixB family protein [Synergistaceae bacterium]